MSQRHVYSIWGDVVFADPDHPGETLVWRFNPMWSYITVEADAATIALRALRYAASYMRRQRPTWRNKRLHARWADAPDLHIDDLGVAAQREKLHDWLV